VVSVFAAPAFVAHTSDEDAHVLSVQLVEPLLVSTRVSNRFIAARERLCAYISRSDPKGQSLAAIGLSDAVARR
jgi:hypothetical protein